MVRVAAYCRVSTDKDDQANSFESQQRYFREYIERNPDWELVKIYPDEGISGTNTKKRKEFNRMIAAAKAGKIDLIITKEVSRFARNTVDTLQYTRDLKKLGVYVFFMNDNINTKDPDSELRLTIMASIAQEESRKTSERVKWGQKRRMEQGVVFGRDMLGYDVRDGKLFINEAGAEVVRLIFHKFLEEGKGTYTIARELREAGIETSTPMKNWTNTVILRALRNEKYCGDLIQKKTYTPDYLSHDKKYNRGEEEFVVLRDHHEPIISRELFDKAQVRLKAAQQKATKTTVGWEEDERAFYNVFYCGDCKRKMCTRRCKGNVYYFCNAAWYRDERKCRQKSISEDKLQKIVRSELTRQLQLSGLRKKDMSAISSAVFLSKINEIQTEIRKLDADMERRSEKLAQAFMQYKEGELSKEAYIEMKDDRNSWKEFCEERKKSLEQTIRKLEKQQKEETRFLRSLLELDGTTRINAELAEGLIESMYLYGDGKLEINFGFKGVVEHE